MLARRRGVLLADLADLAAADLCAEIAGLQWELVIEAAQAVELTPREERGQALRRLAYSESTIDRYAAQLVRQWRATDRARP